MYNQRKKKIIILTIVIILVIIGLGVAGAYAYFATDLLKSNETLFMKYFGQSVEEFKYEENTQLSEIANLKQNKPYEIDGTLTYDGDLTGLSNAKINLQAIADKTSNAEYAKVDLLKNKDVLSTVEYANSNNIFALKSDEVANAYIGIENDNLKVLAQKLGIYDTSDIPDTLETKGLNSINDVLKISDEEIKYINETYSKVLLDNINSSNFTKERELAIVRNGVTYSNLTGYRLRLNGDELKQVQIALLETLKQDSITLNSIATKAKALGLDENYSQVNNLTKQIDERIKSLNNYQPSEFDSLSIMVYVDNMQAIATEIIYRNETKITFYGIAGDNSNSRHIVFEDFDVNANISKIEIDEQETRNTAYSDYNINVNINDETQIKVNIVNSGSASQNTIETTATLSIENNNKTHTLNYEQQMVFTDDITGIIKLDRTNTAVLNDYTTEQIQSLIQALAQRIGVVISEKIEKIGVYSTVNDARQSIISNTPANEDNTTSTTTNGTTNTQNN